MIIEHILSQIILFHILLFGLVNYIDVVVNVLNIQRYIKWISMLPYTLLLILLFVIIRVIVSEVELAYCFVFVTRLYATLFRVIDLVCIAFDWALSDVELLNEIMIWLVKEILDVCCLTLVNLRLILKFLVDRIFLGIWHKFFWWYLIFS